MRPALVVTLYALCAPHAHAEVAFCDRDAHTRRHAHVEATKRVNEYEYAHIHESKVLYCCFRGFLAIDWYKDGAPSCSLTSAPRYKDGAPLLQADTDYSDLTTFLMTRDGGRELVSLRVRPGDSGGYTCVARGAGGAPGGTHTVNLTAVFYDEYEGRPMMTVTPKDTWAHVGDSREITCEAFVGFGRLTTAISQVLWMDWNQSFVDKAISYSSADRQVLGSTLTFTPVTAEAFGKYMCHVTNGVDIININITLWEGDDPNTPVVHEYTRAVALLSAVAMVMLVSVALGLHWRVEIRLLWKDRIGRLEDRDDKLYDVFVCYDAADAAFVDSLLLPVLEERCGYRCFSWERDAVPGDWIPEAYTSSVRQSRRFLLVLSRSLATNPWCTYALYVAIDAMLQLHSRIICILLQEMDWEQLSLSPGNSDTQTLRQVVRVVRTVQWEHGGSRRFWNKLRLHLPPRRGLALHLTVDTPSQESLGTPLNP